MATKAGLFNHALIELGHRVLQDTGEAVEAGRILNTIYDDVVKQCIANGPWHFAMETSQPSSGGATPTLGYDHVYTKPSTWIATESIATVNTKFATPVLSYYEDRDYWAADTGHIDVRYVSSDTGAGFEIAKWPPLFTRYVELELAFQTAPKLTQATQEMRERLGRDRDQALGVALDRERFVPPWPTFTSTTTSKARIIHAALLELGNLGKISVRDDDARRAVHRFYDDVVRDCLAANFWNFAMESMAAEADTGPTTLGYTHVYQKPSGWLRTHAMATDSGFANPLLSYYDDPTYWACDTGAFYVRYLSNDTGAGMELARWPAPFVRFVEIALAYRACDNLLEQSGLARIMEEDNQKGGQRDADQRLKLAAALKERLLEQRELARKRAIELESFVEPWPTFASGTSRASIIHNALIELGNLGKVSLRGDDARRGVGRIYDHVVAECLASNFWNFGIETSAMEADTGPTTLGFSHVYNKPSDWVRTHALAKDVDFTNPLLAYYDDATWWAADTGAFYARYLSDDTGAGMEIARWPAAFTRFVELELAYQACGTIVAGDDEGAAKVAATLKTQLFELKEAAKLKAIALESFVEPWPTHADAISKLNIIQASLMELGLIGKVTQLTDDQRRVMDRLYTQTIDHCLSVGSWNFATETIKADADTGVTPEFGYSEVFAKPGDWVRTVAVSADEDFITPLTAYYDDANFWSAAVTPIYVRYVSDDTGQGYELNRWPALFRRYVELELAMRAGPAIAKDVWKVIGPGLEKQRDKAQLRALNHDTMNEPQPKFPPTGGWTNSRGGSWGGRRDRGSRGSLTG